MISFIQVKVKNLINSPDVSKHLGISVLIRKQARWLDFKNLLKIYLIINFINDDLSDDTDREHAL